MFKFSVLALAAAIGLGAAAPASATVYTWTLTGANAGSGTISTGAADNGGYDITAIDGTIDGVAIAGLLGGQPGSATYSPLGAFVYDNILYPQASQVLDNWGILIAMDGVEGNIWGNFAGTGGYSYYLGDCGGCYTVQSNADTFSLTGVLLPTESLPDIPEPATLSLLGAGLFGIGLIRRRHQA
jgi:hypothetical protein